MDSKKGKGEQKKQDHEAIRIEEDRILLPIPIVRMGIILGKTRGSSGVTLPAGSHDIFPVNGRTGVFRRQDIMRSVAIRAPCAHRTAQGGHMSMKRVPIGLHPFYMACSTFPHHPQLPGFHLHPLNLVGAVAICADRRLGKAFL